MERDRPMTSSPEPIVKWVGGKSKLVPTLLERMGDLSHYDRFVDVFAGSLSVSLAGSHPNVWSSDINRPLIHTYQSVSAHLDEMMPRLDHYNTAELNTKDSFERNRTVFNSKKEQSVLDIDTACLFLYLNRRGFNGMYRENRKGEFNISYREYKSGIYNGDRLKEFQRWSTEREIRWSSLSYEGVFAELKAGDFVYLDPPYYTKDPTSGFTSYWRTGFGVEDQKRLASAVRDLDSRGVVFLMSNAPCPEIRELYAGFHQETLCLQRQMRSAKGKTSANDDDNEILITNRRG